MPIVTPETDLNRAKGLRALTKGIRSVEARRKMEEAAQRLENRAASKVSKIGRKRRRKPVMSVEAMTRGR